VRDTDTIDSSGTEEEPVSVLQRFEKRLEGLVEGAFAKVFKGVVHPVEILNAMQREAEAHKAILAGGRTLVPNRYVIDLSPYDHSRLAPYAAALAQELAQSQAEFIGEQAWTVYGDVIVEIERGEGLDTGMFRVTAEVFSGDQVPQPAPMGPPMPEHAPPPPPGYGPPPYEQQGHPGGPPPGMPPMGGQRNARLVSGDGRTYPLAIGSTVIGRGDQATLRLPDVGISRRHARIDYDGTQVVLTDLGSTNGSMVNGQRVSAVALNPGDMLQIGTTTLTFRVDG
jgi:FHA domain-containing protein